MLDFVKVDLDDFAQAIDCGPAPFRRTPDRSASRQPQSRFESIAMLSCGLSGHLGLVIDILLSSCRDRGLGRHVLRPLWAEEAMQRAYTFARLAAVQNERDGAMSRTLLQQGIELVLARDLAALFGSLEAADESEVVQCSGVLRNMVCNLDALFGNVAGQFTLRTDIERTALPAYKRRALVLAAAELVASAILQAFPGRVRGQLEVTLKSAGPGHSCLRVTDDGIGFAGGKPHEHARIASLLADLLEGDLAHEQCGARMTVSIVFPS